MGYKGPVEGRILSFEVDVPSETCCTKIFFHITEKERIIRYQKRDRVFGIVINNNAIQKISYCPWCGKKLPKDLSDEFWDIIENELRIETSITDLEDNPLIPEEFKTDEWWKKRGL